MNYPYHPTSKADLRTRIRNQRRALSPAVKDFLDQQLVAHLLKLIDAYSTIAAYVPLPDEPGGDYLVRITYSGTGSFADASQPGWFDRFFLSPLFPF